MPILSRTMRHHRATVAAWAGRLPSRLPGNNHRSGSSPARYIRMCSDTIVTKPSGMKMVRSLPVLRAADLHLPVVGPLHLRCTRISLRRKSTSDTFNAEALSPPQAGERAHRDERRVPGFDVLGRAHRRTDLLDGGDGHRSGCLARPGEFHLFTHVTGKQPVPNGRPKHVAHIGEPRADRRRFQPVVLHPLHPRLDMRGPKVCECDARERHAIRSQVHGVRRPGHPHLALRPFLVEAGERHLLPSFGSM